MSEIKIAAVGCGSYIY